MSALKVCSSATAFSRFFSEYLTEVLNIFSYSDPKLTILNLEF